MFKMPAPYKTYLELDYFITERGRSFTIVHQEFFGTDFNKYDKSNPKRFTFEDMTLHSSSPYLPESRSDHTMLLCLADQERTPVLITPDVSRIIRAVAAYNLKMNGLPLPTSVDPRSKPADKPDEWLKIRYAGTAEGHALFYFEEQARCSGGFWRGDCTFYGKNKFNLVSSGTVQIDAGVLAQNYLYVCGADDCRDFPRGPYKIPAAYWDRFVATVNQYNEEMEKLYGNERGACALQAEAEPLVISAFEVQEGSAMVKVQYGVNVLEQAAGLTVGQIRERLAGVMGIPAGASAEINGDAADSSTVCNAGDEVEFVRVAGSKG